MYTFWIFHLKQSIDLIFAHLAYSKFRMSHWKYFQKEEKFEAITKSMHFVSFFITRSNNKKFHIDPLFDIRWVAAIIIDISAIIHSNGQWNSFARTTENLSSNKIFNTTISLTEKVYHWIYDVDMKKGSQIPSIYSSVCLSMPATHTRSRLHVCIAI